ncbi:alpha/beta hydrolase-fold protein [Planctobacterium marinum]|uniref:alpha/beta hydrolase-fold protein n=1 Tax=Planctobacterium marinum TaxID=1631968 RepID=UPI001E60E436|nr:alpha/beta hydrolase-fold protein [Planctobacterium marinum]MCC2606972.1 hypothetical protein [Planctobacterium marinum]
MNYNIVKDSKKLTVARLLTLCLLLFMPLASVTANESHDIFMPVSENAFSNVFRHSIDSKNLNAKRTVDVSLPVNYAETAENITYPLIVVLDGELLFNSAASFAQLQAMNSQMPEAIVVGIPNAPDARRDMTPKPLGKNGEPLWFGGQEDSYLSFIQHEVLPLIEKNYRVANFKILIGLSPSANFSLHSFWKQPNLFSGYIAVNGADFNAAGYEGESVFEKVVKSVKQQEQNKRYLYISMPKGGVTRNPHILEKYNELSDELTPHLNKQIEFKWEVIDKKSYAAVLPAIMSGLKLIFPAEEWDPSYNNFIAKEPGQTLANIKTYYATLSDKYGFTALPKGERFYNRNRLKRIVYVLINEQRYTEAEAVLNYWLSLYPQSANAYDTYADLYRAQDNAGAELEYRAKAVKVAQKNQDLRVALFESSLRELQERKPAP